MTPELRERLALMLAPVLKWGTDYDEVPTAEIFSRPRYQHLAERVFVAADAALAELASAGYVVVPKEPTEAMLDEAYLEIADKDGAARSYRAMLAAAPSGEG